MWNVILTDKKNYSNHVRGFVGLQILVFTLQQKTYIWDLTNAVGNDIYLIGLC